MDDVKNPSQKWERIVLFVLNGSRWTVEKKLEEPE
jgi:hypothetical protein